MKANITVLPATMPQIPKPFPVTKGSPKSASVCSGSVDGVEYSERKEKGLVKMTVPRTLALCSLSLLWQRETITVSDLLRFVEEDHIPYINAFKLFPEEMKVYGRDKGIFAIESWPDYEDIYKNMIELAIFLDLPRFPDITEDCYLHPNTLCMKYLLEVNLPDEMHTLTCQVVKLTGIGEVDFLTFDPIAKTKRTVKYDVQAMAVIVVVLKLLFLLDDKLEWSYSDLAEAYNEQHREDTPQFDFRKWYQVMKKTFDEKRRKWEEARASYCKHVTTYEESNFSLSYQFILNIFSFLLRIKTSALHEEVSLLEKKLFEKKYNESKKSSGSKKGRRH